MAKLPDVEDLGPRPIPESRRQLATVRNAGAVGGAVAEFGRTASAVVERLEEIHDEDDARRLDVEHAEAAREIRLRARQARGVNAEAARQRADEELTALNQSIIQRARSRTSRTALEQLVTRRSTLERDSIAEHTLRETTATMEAAMTARVDASLRQAEEHWDNPDAVEAGIRTAVAEVENRGRWRGTDPAVIATERATAVSRVRTSVAQQMVAGGDYPGALAYVDAHSGEIDHDQEVALRRAIRGPMIEDAADTIVDSLPAITGQAVEGEPTTPGAAPAALPAAPTIIAETLRRTEINGRPIPEAVVAGFLGNLEHENGFRAGGTPGDGGTAHGIAQWRHERVANFRRVIGTDIRNSTVAQQAQFIAWEMQHPAEAGMTVEQRDAILAAGSPEDAARLIDQFYERSSGQSRGQREAAARRYAGGVAGTPSAPTGRVIDYTAARQQIDALGLMPDQRRAAIAALDRRVSAEDRVRGDQVEAVTRQITQRLVEIHTNGEELTSISQIDPALITEANRVAPSLVLQLQSQIEANNRREDVQANSPLMADLVVTAGTDPNRYLREVNPEMYRGRVTDAEVEQLHRMRIDIQNRTGPQPSQILSVVRWVLPPAGNSVTARTERRNVEARLLSAAQGRLARLFPQGTPVTQQDILNAVRAEVTEVTAGGQRMNLFEAEERGVANTVQLEIPTAALPAIDEVLRRSGTPISQRSRGEVYLRYRSEFDAIH